MEFKTVEKVLQSYSEVNEAGLLRLKIVIYQTKGKKKKILQYFFPFKKKSLCLQTQCFYGMCLVCYNKYVYK